MYKQIDIWIEISIGSKVHICKRWINRYFDKYIGRQKDI